MIKSVVIQNYKIFKNFELSLHDGLNIIVGDNEAGKSTILEAIHLCLTKRLNGRSLESELSPFLLNSECAKDYVDSVQSGAPLPPPPILIELYLSDDPQLQYLRGSMNSRKEDSIGIKLHVVFDEDFAEEYKHLLANGAKEIAAVPTEYYKINWYSFANNPVSARGLPTKVSFIDATTIRLQSGTDYYLQEIIRNELDGKERAALSLAYRSLKEIFSQNPSIKAINKHLTGQKGAITDKELSISIDASQRTNWEGNLTPHLDQLPFHLVGKGEQNALKIMLALERKSQDVNLILIEEPENHLSFSSMTKLIRKIQEKCDGKQIIVTTHSTYVLNKLGLDRLILLANKSTTSLISLPSDTQAYFKKLSGYDTLRLILAKRAILVEGPSDELIVQRAFCDEHKSMPIDAGVDVINVRGLSFPRFLDIAKDLKSRVAVVTDNDGDFAAVDTRYAPFSAHANIRICRSDDNDHPTLEPQMLKHNGRQALNKILGRSFTTDSLLLDYMAKNKAECALRIFETTETVTMPPYILDAIA